MDPITGAAIGGGAVLTGVLGFLSNKSAQDRAEALQDKSFKEWLSVNIPDPRDQKLALEQFVVTGKLTPQLETAIKQDPSAFEKVNANAQLKASRMRSLKSLEDLGTGAETFQDKAAQQKALIDSAAKSRGEQQAITSSLGQRGQLGTGLELTARMSGAQAAGDRNASNALDIESQRRARAFKAIESAGNLAGQMSNDDLKLQSDKARASDAISNFNTRNMQDVLSRNVNTSNKAQEYNLNNEQDISNKNTSMRNYEQEKNKNLFQQEFENKAKRAAGITGQYDKGADRAIQSGQSAAQFWGSLAGNIPKAVTAVGQYKDESKPDEDEKEQEY